MNIEAISTDLQSGTTLAKLAQQNGVSSKDLLASVEKDLQANAPQGAPSLSSDQIKQIASDFINGTTPSTPASASATFPRPPLVGNALERYHGPKLEVVVPVYNEEAALELSIRSLHDFLVTSMPFAWRIVIADNASTDRTWEIAVRLEAELNGVGALRLGQKGRGRALRAVWSASDADIVCYMDVDLSTDLRALLPLVAGLISGYSDVAIGSRLAAGAQIVRSRKRELISRAYNRLLRLVLRARFSDAQCGFKAIRADAARVLLPEIEDDGWFFDTELLILAQRRGLRIHEVPVDWVEDPDTRVDLISTAVGDLRGVGRLLIRPRRAHMHLSISDLRLQAERVCSMPMVRFVGIGVVSTLAYALLFLILAGPLGSSLANAVSLVLTAVANTAANRRLTFGVRGRQAMLRHHVDGLAMFALQLAMTDAALALLHSADPHSARALELTVLLVASFCATVTRYVGMSTLLFGASRTQRQHHPLPTQR
ncbi:MAG: glycosyltransferase [Solirubrobacteraceae bacterium]